MGSFAHASFQWRHTKCQNNSMMFDIRDHFGPLIIAHKILVVGYWWPSLHKDVSHFCRSCDICQRTGPIQGLGFLPLTPIITIILFVQWGIDFVGRINPIAHRIRNCYILVTIDYAMNQTEAKAFTNNTTIANTRFFYEHIIIKFVCPLKLINNQGGHFINETIEVFIAERRPQPTTLEGMVKQKTSTR